MSRNASRKPKPESPLASLNKRRAPRVTMTGCVMELYDNSGRLILGVGQLLDCSTVGACFASTTVLLAGAELRARIRSPGKKVVEIPARVVWTRRKAGSTLYGIEFDAKLKI